MDKKTRTWLLILTAAMPFLGLIGILLPTTPNIVDVPIFREQAAGQPFQAPAFQVPDEGWTGRNNTALVFFDSIGSGVITETVTGGGCRLIGNATSPQIACGASGNIVSGNGSVVAGGGTGGALNTISSGEFSAIGGGAGNDIDAPYSVIGAGIFNTINGDGTSVIAGGESNVASADHVVVGGGTTNSATADEAIVCGGQLNTASETYSVVCGGLSNLADGSGSFVASGNNNDSLGDMSFTRGTRAVASHYGEMASAAGRFAADGDAQAMQFIARRQVTHSNANWYTLYLDGTDDLMTIPAESAWTFEAKIVGITSNSGAQWSYLVNGLIERDNANNTTLGAFNTTTIFESDANFDAQAAADDANEALLIQVQDTGSSSVTIRWVTEVEIVQVIY